MNEENRVLVERLRVCHGHCKEKPCEQKDRNDAPNAHSLSSPSMAAGLFAIQPAGWIETMRLNRNKTEQQECPEVPVSSNGHGGTRYDIHRAWPTPGPASRSQP